MLPDDYENLAESVVATNFFGNNILQAITTKNYWDVVNDFKPLMHTWYMGVLMQYYVVVPFLMFVIAKVAKKDRKYFTIGALAIVGVVSFLAYLFIGSLSDKFYFTQYRLFEFCAGSLVFYALTKGTNTRTVSELFFVVAYILLIALLFMPFDSIPKQLSLIATVLLTSVLLYSMPRARIAQNKVFSNRSIAIVGASSLSLYVWHQIVFAFTRYSFTNDLLYPVVLVSMFAIIIVLSVLSYRLIEKMHETRMKWGATFVIFVLSTVSSLHIYANAGVVRDVPELGTKKGQVHRGLWAEYCDRGYLYDKDFSNNNKPKWLVIGNSFGRDFVNIIEESKIADSVEVSYADMETYKQKADRFKKADVVFLSTLGVNTKWIRSVNSLITNPNTRFFIIGEKNFGESNGLVYRHRFSKNYHDFTVSMEDGYAERNDTLKSLYPNNYIDLITLAQRRNGKVRVFTDNGKFISQDCRHLTKAGAEWYASKIDWKRFLTR